MTTDLPTAYPLQWPLGRPRTSARAETWAFRKQRNRERHTVYESTAAISLEIRMLDGGNLVISTNLRVGANGWPLSKQANPTDPGVAVYFLRGNQNVCFACDKWSRVEDNLWATFLTLEALRGVDRWGAASLEATFTGYLAIAAPAGGMWFEVLDVSPRASAGEITAAYRAKAKTLHPDAPGGSHEAFVKLKAAYETAVQLGLVSA